MKKVFLPFVNRRFVTAFGAAGNFDASEHLNFLVKAEEMWSDAKFKDDYIAHVDCVVQLVENQTARFRMLDDPDKDNVVNVTWIVPCAIEVADNDGDNCELEETELETTSQDYEMTLTKRTGFKINEEKIRTGTYSKEEQVAAGLLRASKVLDEWWALQVLLKYKTYAGPNIPVIAGRSTPFTWDAVNTTSNLPAGNYDVKIVSNIIKQQQLNNVNQAFFVENGDLFEPFWNAQIQAGNLDGAGDAARVKQLKLAFDMWNFQKAALTETMFMVEKNAVCLKTYNRHKSGINEMGGKVNQTWYTVPSRNIPGVMYDVIYEMKCETVGGKSNITHVWRLITYGDIFLNPQPCPITVGETEYTPTGVYSFTKTA